jgi:HSP20 family molecular chaperone IbpA
LTIQKIYPKEEIMNIDETILAVEKLYHDVTGQQLPSGTMKHTVQPNVDPIALLETRLHELHHLLQEPSVWRSLQPWAPPMSIWESDEKILVRLDLPAVGKEDVDISLRGNVLIVTGTRQAIPQMSGFMPRLTEPAFGHFHRAIHLPIENFSPEISSNIKDGVLEITIHKQAGAGTDRGTKKNGGGKSMQ